mmetsp:Transcript_24669/g.38760  ORF Transcript_24669/g.38760 Transcript_24669/m.38760 type:complete len:112 (-) Transcript_24669:263-598(-)
MPSASAILVIRSICSRKKDPGVCSRFRVCGVPKGVLRRQQFPKWHWSQLVAEGRIAIARQMADGNYSAAASAAVGFALGSGLGLVSSMLYTLQTQCLRSGTENLAQQEALT